MAFEAAVLPLALVGTISAPQLTNTRTTMMKSKTESASSGAGDGNPMTLPLALADRVAAIAISPAFALGPATLATKAGRSCLGWPEDHV